MIVPERYYRRIADLYYGFSNPPHRAVLASATMERLLADLPESDRLKVRSLLERGLDQSGHLDARRLSYSERAFIHAQLAEGIAQLMGE